MQRLRVCLVLVAAVSTADADNKLPPCPIDSSPLIWHLYEIGAFDTGYDGTGVTIAHFDSGFPRNWDVYLPPDSVDETYAAGFGPLGRGSAESDHGTPAFYGLDNGHSIWAAAFIVGLRTPPDIEAQYGVGPCAAGVATGARILPIRVYARGDAYGDDPNELEWVAEGYRYIANLKRRGAFPGGIIINASFGFEHRSDEQDRHVIEAVDDAIDAGVILVAAAGNEGPGEDTVGGLPGRLDQMISVGAAGFTGEKAFAEDPLWFLSYEDPPFFPQLTPPVYVAGFSSRGAPVDLIAPGAWVAFPSLASSGRGVNGYSRLTPPPTIAGAGSSFAAPHVSGVVALMLEKNPTLRQADVACILKRSALPIPDSPSGVWTSLADEQDAGYDADGPPFSAWYEAHVGPPCPTSEPCAIVPPWGATATGAGLVQAKAALALTPLPGEPLLCDGAQP